MPRQPKVSAAEAALAPRRARGGGERLAERGFVRCVMPPSSWIVVSSSALWSSAVWPVSARNTSSRLGWPSEKSAIRTPARASSATASAARSRVGARRRQRRRVGLEVHGAELVGEHALGLGALLGVEQPHVQRAGADRRLELGRRALGDHAAVVDDGDAVGELVGLVEVLRAEQDRRARRRERADDVPHLVARARVEPGGRLVEEHQLRRDDDAGRDVEPAPHAARVVLDQPAGGVVEVERLEQLGRARLGVGAAQAEQPAEQDQVLAAGQVLVDRGELAGEADERRAPRRPRARCRGRAPGRSRRRAAAAWRASGSWSSCRRRWGRARRRPSRCARRRSTPSTARTSPKDLTRPEASMASGEERDRLTSSGAKMGLSRPGRAR